MNKTELVAAVAEKAGLSKKDAEAAVNAFTDTVTKELKKGEKVQLVGFGTFEVSKRSARTGRNPQTGATMKIAASKAPKFKAGKAFKDALN
ncbi:MAG: DNA-binding protein HU [Firmicutes bacterium ADurb.Bin354]|nr:MAG: DNA-binding protein HU [Firmicutes bacterium ADurb.Bin354]SCY14841.1 DNA-binding protein HU-beta [Lachnospiraceae bacterium XPB1003]